MFILLYKSERVSVEESRDGRGVGEVRGRKLKSDGGREEEMHA